MLYFSSSLLTPENCTITDLDLVLRFILLQSLNEFTAKAAKKCTVLLFRRFYHRFLVWAGEEDINGPSLVSTHTNMHTWTRTLHFDTESKARATNIKSHYCQGYLLNAEHLREVSFCSMKASNKYMLSADIMYSAVLGGRDKMLSELERPALRWQSSGAKYLDRPLLRYYYYCCCLSF